MIDIEGIIAHAEELPCDLFYGILRAEDQYPIGRFIDVGTGMTGIVGQHHWSRVAIDKHALDIYKIRDLPPDWRGHIMDMREMRKHFDEQHFDVIQCCDCLEHIPEMDGHQLLEDFKAMARLAVFLFTPDGWYDNTANKELYQPDNPHQDHQSAWTRGMLSEHGFESRIWGNHIMAWWMRS